MRWKQSLTGRSFGCPTTMLIVSLVAAVSGCGGDDDSPPEQEEQPLGTPPELAAALKNTAPPLTLEQPTWFHRIDLERDAAGLVSLTRVATVELERLPVPSLDPEYLLVSYAGGVVLAAVPVAFPSRALALARADDGSFVHDEVVLTTTSSATVFVASDPALDRVALITREDLPLLELSKEALPEPSLPKRAPPGATKRGLGSLGQPITLDQLEFRYANISFLAPEDTALLHDEVLAGGDIIEPTEAMNDVVADGLARVAPALLSSVQTIAWVSWPVDGRPLYQGFASGSQLALDADQADNPEMASTLVHEVAHNFTDLAGAVGADTGLDDWPPEPAAAARQLLQSFRLAQGMLGTWKNLHDSGRPEGLSEAFEADPRSDGWRARSAQQALAVGFASPYAASRPAEDFAEYTGSVQAPVPGAPGVCSLFAGGGELTPAVAIPYAKLVLLLGVGALTDAAFDACAGAIRVASAPGIHFPGHIAFESELQAGRLNQGAAYGILGSGPNTYQLLVRVQLDSFQTSPLGLHRLDYLGYRNVDDDGLSGALLGNDDVFLARSGEQGLVLFTEARPERSAGVIFGLVLQNAIGTNTDYLPLGTFQIP